MTSVSVIIASYNRHKSLCRAIHSVLAQTLKSVEIIVIDDASTQKEYDTLSKQYSDFPQVKIIRLRENGKTRFETGSPQGYTRMFGIHQSTGKYIAFLDDDDFFIDRTKLQTQFDLLEKYSTDSIKLCCTNMLTKANEIYNKQLPGTKFLNTDLRLFTLETITGLNWTNWIYNSTVMVEKDALLREGGLINQVCEDYECWKRILSKHKAIYIPKPTTYYDDAHGGSTQYQYDYIRNPPQNSTHWISAVICIEAQNHLFSKENTRLRFQNEMNRMCVPPNKIKYVSDVNEARNEAMKHDWSMILTENWLFRRDTMKTHQDLLLIEKKKSKLKNIIVKLSDQISTYMDACLVSKETLETPIAFTEFQTREMGRLCR